MDAWFHGIAHLLATGSITVLPLALVGGLIAGIDPCCLALYPALYPAAAGACCNGEGEAARRSLRRAGAFVLGIALPVAVLGLAAAYLGRVWAMGTWVSYAVACLPILVGMYRLGWIRLPLKISAVSRPGFAGALGTGLLLSLIVAPSAMPELATALSFAAYRRSLLYGGVLLLLYGIGNAVPLMVVGTAAGGIRTRVACSRWGIWLDRFVGGALILFGLFLMWRA